MSICACFMCGGPPGITPRRSLRSCPVDEVVRALQVTKTMLLETMDKDFLAEAGLIVNEVL